MKRDRIKTGCGGFTLVELLTTLAVIGVLLGLLIPALSQVSKTATKVKQKAQFYTIGTALEAFRNDYGDYPPSAWDASVYGNYSAPQRLAEALVGRDGFGFHPDSKFLADGTDGAGTALYAPAVDLTVDTDNLNARRGPYLELESANAVKFGNIFPTAYPMLQSTESYLLVDMYKIVKNNATGKKVGMPILYYKANRMKIGHDDTSGAAPYWPNNTYCLNDSYCNGVGVITGSFGHFNNSALMNASKFYDAIKNPNFTAPVRPYRAESFLLHSAGPDGLYGTVDDVFNFDQDN